MFPTMRGDGSNGLYVAVHKENTARAPVYTGAAPANNIKPREVRRDTGRAPQGQAPCGVRVPAEPERR
jgi:hypothetical protein